MAFCTKCGAALEGGAKFCKACGAAAPTKEGAGDQWTSAGQGSTAGQESTTDQGGTAGQGNGATDKVAAAVDQAQEAFGKFTDTPDNTGEFSQEDIKDGKVLAIFAYIGILVLVPICAGLKNPFVKFHANQGLVLLLANIIYSVARTILVSVCYLMFWPLGKFIEVVTGLFSLVFVAYLFLGIAYVYNNKAKELPIIGKIKLLK